MVIAGWWRTEASFRALWNLAAEPPLGSAFFDPMTFLAPFLGAATGAAATGGSVTVAGGDETVGTVTEMEDSGGVVTGW